jgi:nucleoside 2-deoxyribosyltransferase
MRIYIAGPLGFSEAGRTFYYDKLIPAVRQLGHEALDPWSLTDPGKIATVTNLPYGPGKRDAWRQLNVEIGQNNKAAIDGCDGVIAVLYRVPEIVTRGRFPDGGESDSTWRTQEARHVGSDTIAPGF